MSSILETIKLLHPPGEVIEIRMPKTGYNKKSVYAGYYDDFTKVELALVKYNGKVPGIYINLNPIDPDLLARAANRIDETGIPTASDKDITNRRWLYFDIDPIRPAGISSTDQQHEAAIVKANYIKEYLIKMGWPAPVICDSGNGASLLFRIDIENTATITELIQNCVLALDFLFTDDKTEIDLTVFNPSRIIKLYGTIAKKGDNTPERPHRKSKILEIPSDITIVTQDQMLNLVAMLPKEPEEPKGKSHGGPGLDIEAWMKQFEISYSNTKCWNGKTVFSLEECPFDSNHKAPDSSIILHKSGAVSFHCFHNTCAGHTWQELRAMKEPDRKTKQEAGKKKHVENIGESDPKFTDMRNSRKLAEKINGKAKYCNNWKDWVVYDGKRWVREDGGEMLRYARSVVIDMEKEAILISDHERKKNAISDALRCEATPRLKAMVELCQSEPGVSISEDVFDNDPMLFNVQNGTINLATGKLQPHNPLDYQMKISPVTFDPGAKCDRWLQFLDEALSYGDDEDSAEDKKIHDIKKENIIGYLKRHSGYSMTGVVNEEQFLILFGDGGHGKSKYIGGISYVLGEYHGKVEVQTIQESLKSRDGSSPTPDIARLRGLRFIVCSEPEKGLRLNESRVKDFTGRDPITCRGLHEKPITIMPQFKMSVYTNYRIIIRGQDKSIWRRVHQVGFDKEPKEIDKNLDKKLQKEAAGILNWMLEGCLQWQREGGLNVPQEIKDDVAEYKDEMDLLSDFFSTCCICDKKNKKLTSYGNDLFHLFQSWWGIDNRKDAPYFRQQFLDALSERGFKKIKKDMRGVIVGGIQLQKEVSAAYDDIKTVYDGFKYDAMTAMTSFLVNFVIESRMGKKPDNSVIAVMPSLNPVTPIDCQKIHVAVPQTQNIVVDNTEQSRLKIAGENRKSQQELAEETMRYLNSREMPDGDKVKFVRNVAIIHLRDFDGCRNDTEFYNKIVDEAFRAKNWPCVLVAI